MASLTDLEILCRVKLLPITPFWSFQVFSDAAYSLTIVRHVSNRYCCPVGISGVLDVLCITDEMVTFLHGLGSATRYHSPSLEIFLAWLTYSWGTGSKLAPLPEGLLSWIPQIWKVTDDQILEAAGLDAYVVCVPVKVSKLICLVSQLL